MGETAANTAVTTEKAAKAEKPDKAKKAKLFQRAEKRVQENRLC